MLKLKRPIILNGGSTNHFSPSSVPCQTGKTQHSFPLLDKNYQSLFLLQNTYVTELDANEKERFDRYYAATHFWYHYVYTSHKSKHPVSLTPAHYF